MKIINSEVNFTPTAADNQAAAESNFRVFPVARRIVPNDKVTKKIFAMNDATYFHFLNTEIKNGFQCVEGKKKGQEVITLITFSQRGDIPARALTEFDRDVLSVCISAREQGSKLITLAQILRGLTGQTSYSSNHEIYKNQLAAIKDSLQQLIFTKITVDLSAVNKAFKYACEDTISRPLLPAILPHSKAKINGQLTEIVLFSGESPLMTIARGRKQILNYDAALLDVASQGNSPQIIALKNYTTARVIETSLHRKNMNQSVTFEDIFSKCRVNTSSRKATHDARAAITKIFAHMQTAGIIKTFEVTKKQGSYHGVKFELPPKTPARSVDS